MIALACAQMLMAQGAAAQLRFEGQDDENLPINITSDYMEADNKTNEVVFTGNVVSTRGSMTVKAERMRVFNSEQGRRVEKIIWTGDVHFEMNGQNATAETAIFSDADQTLTLTGNPEAWEGENRIVGEEMVIYLREDKSVVRGGAQKRINVTLFPESMQEQGGKEGVEPSSGGEAGPAGQSAGSPQAE